MNRIIVLLVVMGFGACHPFAMFRPPMIKANVAATSQAPTGVNNAIEIAIDAYGIPFVKANTTDEVFYGLGFMHARDRLFQLDLMRHAALGRTAELFGERTINLDRKFRILTFRLDEQLALLSDEENRLLDAYVRGVNDGARQRGRSAEHFLLGVQFEEFSKLHVIAIARLQSWQLGADLFAEIARLKIAKSKWSMDAKRELLSSIDDRGASIISDHHGFSRLNNLVMPSYLINDHQQVKQFRPDEEEIVQVGGGASNAWVVSGRLSANKNAMLMNDPHLQHTWPSNFYLATLAADDFFVTGASFVGLPGIVIGATNKLSFGVTASCLNTQDSVWLTKATHDDQAYVVDGKNIPFGQWPQRYCLNKTGKCFDEMNHTSIYGPVLTHRFDKWIDKNDVLAVQWTGFRVEQHRVMSSGFLELAKAPNVSLAVNVVKKMTLPGINLVLADTAGDVAYVYAGLVPNRDATQNPYLPLDGRISASLWPGFLNQDKKPAIINPEAGYIITANQNIFGQGAAPELSFGKQGAPPYRALRIKERIEGMLANKRSIDFLELSSIQLDETSVEAVELASLVGPICVERLKDASYSRREFAKELARFDGRYATDSLGALPYEMLMREIVTRRLKDAMGQDMPDGMAYISQTSYAIKSALLNELRGKNTAIFASLKSNNTNGFGDFMSASCEAAYQSVVKQAGARPFTWRWGRHHYLNRQSPLAKVPVIGNWFRDRRREVAGSSSAPMAESGIPVLYGANLRFRVKMSTPPEIYAVIDSGNSGTVGSKNSFDQAKLWHDGGSIAIVTDWAKALKKSVTSFQLIY